jgi:hypothetical protein
MAWSIKIASGISVSVFHIRWLCGFQRRRQDGHNCFLLGRSTMKIQLASPIRRHGARPGKGGEIPSNADALD